jgi:hypothetical protein
MEQVRPAERAQAEWVAWDPAEAEAVVPAGSMVEGRGADGSFVEAVAGADRASALDR